MKHLVIYHGRCVDGYMAAVAFAEAAKHEKELEVTYLPTGYGKYVNTEDFAAHLGGVEKDADYIWFLDTAPTPPIMDWIISLNGPKMFIADHHVTAIESIMEYEKLHSEHFTDGSIRVVYVKERSGASLAEQLFATPISELISHPISPIDFRGMDVENAECTFYSNCLSTEVIERVKSGPRTNLYRLIETRDLWKTENKTLKAQADALSSFLGFSDIFQYHPGEFMEWLSQIGGVENCVSKGMLLDEVARYHADNALENSYYETVFIEGGLPIHVYIGVVPSQLTSVYGEAAYNRHPGERTIAIAVHHDYRSPIIIFGARSRGVKVSQLATHLGGGGHPFAAGFRIDPANYPDYPFTPGMIKAYLIGAIETVYKEPTHDLPATDCHSVPVVADSQSNQ